MIQLKVNSWRVLQEWNLKSLTCVASFDRPFWAPVLDHDRWSVDWSTLNPWLCFKFSCSFDQALFRPGLVPKVLSLGFRAILLFGLVLNLAPNQATVHSLMYSRNMLDWLFNATLLSVHCLQVLYWWSIYFFCLILSRRSVWIFWALRAAQIFSNLL